MKVLLCTGDSHTQGQGQDTFSDPFPEKVVKNMIWSMVQAWAGKDCMTLIAT